MIRRYLSNLSFLTTGGRGKGGQIPISYLEGIYNNTAMEFYSFLTVEAATVQGCFGYLCACTLAGVWNH